ncbi:hypothetical protein GGR53DRAFT_529239 [Hypoxylon sp. FL1150]|nr:hypothetical protein GGR53DRAFT_529239 [Hypoxylon sp. FL1150]
MNAYASPAIALALVLDKVIVEQGLRDWSNAPPSEASNSDGAASLPNNEAPAANPKQTRQSPSEDSLYEPRTTWRTLRVKTRRAVNGFGSCSVFCERGLGVSWDMPLAINPKTSEVTRPLQQQARRSSRPTTARQPQQQVIDNKNSCWQQLASDDRGERRLRSQQIFCYFILIPLHELVSDFTFQLLPTNGSAWNKAENTPFSMPKPRSGSPACPGIHYRTRAGLDWAVTISVDVIVAMEKTGLLPGSPAEKINKQCKCRLAVLLPRKTGDPFQCQQAQARSRTRKSVPCLTYGRCAGLVRYSVPDTIRASPTEEEELGWSSR